MCVYGSKFNPIEIFHVILRQDFKYCHLPQQWVLLRVKTTKHTIK